MIPILRLFSGNRLVGLLVLVGLFLSLRQAQAAPTIVSTAPPNTATAPVVFTFSEAMNTSATSVRFQDGSTFLGSSDEFDPGLVQGE